MYVGWQSIAKLPICQSDCIEGKHRDRDFTSRDIEHPEVEVRAIECRLYLGWQSIPKLPTGYSPFVPTENVFNHIKSSLLKPSTKSVKFMAPRSGV